MKLSRRLFLLSPLALAYKPSWGALSFPLPQGHFVPAKMPMHPVYPRPDAETQAHARHRWAHPDFRYEIPIGVQGGAWPFKYEIINGPSGATIGQYYGDSDYGVLKWTPANGDSGTKAFTVRVTDQELKTVDLSWTTTIDTNQFVFVDANAASTGSGTLTNPLKTFADWYKDDREDSTYHNKIIVFRDGNYSAIGASVNNGNIRLDSDSKTPSLIGFPDERPVIDCSSAKFFTSTGLDDIFIAGIKFKNARTDVSNPHFFWASGAWNRGTWFDVVFDTLGMGTVNNDNPSAVFATAVNSGRENVLFKNIRFENFLSTGSNGSYIDLYTISHVLIEGCSVHNSNTTYGLWMKGTWSFVTIRNNDLSNNVSGRGVTLGYGPGATRGVLPHDHEICWNCFISSSPSTSMLQVVSHSDYAGQHYNTFIYRNTFSNGEFTIRFIGVSPYKTDGNVISSNDLSGWSDPTRVTSGVPNLLGKPSQNLVDSSGKLIGDYRRSNLGIAGHEISDTYVRTPKPPKVNL